MAIAAERVEPLSIWNQAAPRVYISVAQCFPLDRSDTSIVSAHLRSSLELLVQDRPIFAGRIEPCLGKVGLLQLHLAPVYKIPFAIDHVPGRYEQIKADGFPPARFVGPQFIPTPTDNKTAACRVHAYFIGGGLILVFSLHHSLFDADCVGTFMEWLAAQTGGNSIDRPTEQAFQGPCFDDGDKSLFEKYLALCPEHTILPNLSGPTQPKPAPQLGRPKTVRGWGKCSSSVMLQSREITTDVGKCTSVAFG